MSIAPISVISFLSWSDGWPLAGSMCLPGIISCDELGERDGVAAGIFMPGRISRAGSGEAAGTFMLGCPSCDGLLEGVGDAAGTFIPG